VLVVDFTVGVMPVGAVTVAPLRPVPLIVTEDVGSADEARHQEECW
jgi:hypothetical protein